MASNAETEPIWEQPRRRRVPRAVWVGAAIVVAAAVGGVIAGGGADDLAVDDLADDGLTVDERDAPGGEPTPAVLDPAGWAHHASPDDAAAIAAAPDGGVWAATRSSGLVRWDANGDHAHHPVGEEFAARVADRGLTTLAVAGDGTVWAAALPRGSAGSLPEAGLARFDGQAWTAGDAATDPPLDLVTGLAVDDEGGVWAGGHVTGRGGDRLARFDGREWTGHTPADGVPIGRLAGLAVGDDGAVWAATRTDHRPDQDVFGGLARYADGEWTAWHAGEDLPVAHVTGLATGPDGSVWAVGGRDPGPAAAATTLMRFDGERWATVATADDAPADTFGPPTVGPDGALWVPARHRDGGRGQGAGVARFADGEWTTWTTADGLPHDSVRVLTVTEDETVWAATPAGVAHFDDDRGRWTAHVVGHGPASDHVISVAADDDGHVWAGTSAGLSRFDGDAWTRSPGGGELDGDLVEAVAVDDEAVWAGTLEGVGRFDGETWQRWTADDGLGHDRAVSLAADGDAVWAVTAGWGEPFGATDPTAEGAVARFDGDAWQRWTRDELPLEGLPVAVAADDDGALWLAARSVSGESPDTPRHPGGVARFADGEWTAWTTADGLPHDDVRTVDVADGLVWAGTAQGVARFDGEQWVDADTEGNPLNLGAGDPPGDSPIATVAAGDAGTAWVGSRAPWNVARFDGRAWTVPEPPPWLTVRAVAVGDAAAWLATGNGVVRVPLT